MRDFAIEFVGTVVGGMLAALFDSALHHRIRPRRVAHVPRPGGYWN